MKKLVDLLKTWIEEVEKGEGEKDVPKSKRERRA